ncbi:hypothetical protein Val02_62860 [Virgisporangium aliadipatigenens]|uniref:Uncharacterized protein n=1 Tax=Virgisporangium aliadipatigenens TaxID=741659 RepID=A0A8J3YT41_9ACTN|nr:hypothetical protein Val02_62860 [Virgisporangium aliadipatigenens]
MHPSRHAIPNTGNSAVSQLTHDLRAELINLVYAEAITFHEANQMLQRLDLLPLRRRYQVSARVTVSTTVTSSNDAAAGQYAVAAINADLAHLHGTELVARHPIRSGEGREVITALRTAARIHHPHRLPADTYVFDADIVLATTVAAADHDGAWRTAQDRIARRLAELPSRFTRLRTGTIRRHRLRAIAGPITATNDVWLPGAHGHPGSRESAAPEAPFTTPTLADSKTFPDQAHHGATATRRLCRSDDLP